MWNEESNQGYVKGAFRGNLVTLYEEKSDWREKTPGNSKRKKQFWEKPKIAILKRL